MKPVAYAAAWLLVNGVVLLAGCVRARGVAADLASRWVCGRAA